MGKTRHDEESVNFYIEQFCSKADVVYRLAFALTLNLDAAHKITTQVFQKVSDGIAKLAADTTNPRTVLLKACWETYRKAGTGGSAGQSALISALKGLSVDARAALVATDYAGVAADELADIFGWDQTRSRQLLAEGRRHLLGIDIKL